MVLSKTFSNLGNIASNLAYSITVPYRLHLTSSPWFQVDNVSYAFLSGSSRIPLGLPGDAGIVTGEFKTNHREEEYDLAYRARGVR